MKREYVTALVILLIISNILTLGLIWNHLSSESKAIPVQTPMMQPYRLQAALHLSDQQVGQYNQVKARFIQSAQPLADSLWTEKNRLMEALTHKTTDTATIHTIESNISLLQQQLFRQSIDQYIAIKSILRPDQQKELTKVYYSMFGCGRHGMGMGRGIMNR